MIAGLFLDGTWNYILFGCHNNHASKERALHLQASKESERRTEAFQV